VVAFYDDSAIYLYWLMCSVTRIGEDDPEARRKENDFAIVLVQDGIGKLVA